MYAVSAFSGMNEMQIIQRKMVLLTYNESDCCQLGCYGWKKLWRSLWIYFAIKWLQFWQTSLVSKVLLFEQAFLPLRSVRNSHFLKFNLVFCWLELVFKSRSKHFSELMPENRIWPERIIMWGATHFIVFYCTVVILWGWVCPGAMAHVLHLQLPWAHLLLFLTHAYAETACPAFFCPLWLYSVVPSERHGTNCNIRNLT